MLYLSSHRGFRWQLGEAIGNVVAGVAGVHVRDLPLTWERVARAIEES
jgi:CO/xanthine dehydrogenase Mo-binding subunit